MIRNLNTRFVWAAATALMACVIGGLGACLDSGAVPCDESACLAGYQCVVEATTQSSVCLLPEDIGRCGNGVLEEGELCDDGNTAAGDGCSADCDSNESCGNGIIDGGEECDCGGNGSEPGPGCDGRVNSDEGGVCRTDCRLHCGDGELAADEACDGVPAQHCTDFGYDLGRLDCSDRCELRFDDCDDLGWQYMESPTLATLLSIWGSGPDDVFAVGSAGTILHYDGVTWEIMESPTPFQLEAVWGTGPSDVFAVGSAGTILHYDGDAWTEMDSPIRRWLFDVWGSAGNNVYAVGQDGRVIHYNGEAWLLMPPLTAYDLSSIWGSSPENIIAAGESAVMFRYNGSSWDRWPSPFEEKFDSSIYAIRGIGTDNLFITARDGQIAHHDGSDWRANSLDTGWIMDLWLSGSNDIYAVSHDNHILHYDGYSWAIVETAHTSLRGVWGTGPDNVFVVGSSGTIMHFSGKQFSPMETVDPEAMSLTSVWGVDSESLVAVGNAGRVVHASDGQWQSVEKFENKTFRGVFGSGLDDLVAVGTGGTIMHRRGAQWTDEPALVDVDLNAVWHAGQGTWYAAGAGGVLLRNTGDGWQEMTSPTDDERLGLWGSGPDNVFAVGRYGTIVRHTGGDTWSSMPSNVSAHLHAIWGSGPDRAFAVGDQSTIISYDGATWTPIDWTGAETQFIAVGGSSRNDVLAAGTGSTGFTLAHYDGERWTPIAVEAGSFAVRSLWVDDTGTTAVFVGDRGESFKLERRAGGLTWSGGRGLGRLIPDDGYDGTLASMACVDILATAAPIRSVVVGLAMDHDRAGDVTIKVESPAGTIATLLNRPGFDESADDGQGEGGATAALAATAPITFTDSGAFDAETMGQDGDVVCADDDRCAYRPNPGSSPGDGLGDFAGENAAGTWSICVGDAARGMTGVIDSVTLTVQAGDVSDIVECGNGTSEYGEQCDDGNNTDGDGCNATCTSNETCGNGVVDGSVGEECDDGGNSSDCNADCTRSRCGDGYANAAAGEACDDGNSEDEDGCSSTCIIECGDGVVQPLEECDDGNRADGDGCTESCQREVCGDGIINNNGSEACDDGNATPGDGCDGSCAFEPFAEVEPNDAAATANVGRPTTLLIGQIAPEFDFDYVTLDALAGQTLTLEVTDTGDGSCAAFTLDSEVAVYAPDGTTQVAFNDDSGSNWCSRVVYVVAGDGTYYVRVASSQQWLPTGTFSYHLLATVR